MSHTMMAHMGPDAAMLRQGMGRRTRVSRSDAAWLASMYARSSRLILGMEKGISQ